MSFLKSFWFYNKVFLFLILFVFISANLKNDFKVNIPKGFPQLPIREDNPLTKEKVLYGKSLFFEKLLSRDSSLSCASCHKPEYAFTDGKVIAEGIKNRKAGRNTPTLTNIAYNNNFLRDGVNPSLEAQVIVPIHEKNEFDFQILLVAERLKKKDKYIRLSQQAFGEEPNPNNISKAIASFERTLISGNSRYDKFKFQYNISAMSNNEKKGMHLFFNKLYCGDCHSGFNFSNGTIVNNGLYKEYLDKGRMRLTLSEKDNGCYKVPTLRNISLTNPYMHDGSLSTLEEVIDHYSNGGSGHVNQHSSIKPFQISREEKDYLISFLKCLTDSSFIYQE